MSYSTIIVERNNHELHLWLNRPEVKNALSGEMITEASDVLNKISHDRSIRTLIIRGKEEVFCAGGDIKGFKSSQEKQTKESIAQGNRIYGTFLQLVNSIPQTTVMVVEGAAIGGGLGLTCVADVSLTTKTTKFALTETSLGIPPAQIALFVVQRLGLPLARKLMLTGARLKGEKAVQIGLVDYCLENSQAIDEFLPRVLAEITRCAPQANAKTKAILMATLTLKDNALLDFAAEKFAECMLSGEASEGVAAFLEKRKPTWDQS